MRNIIFNFKSSLFLGFILLISCKKKKINTIVFKEEDAYKVVNLVIEKLHDNNDIFWYEKQLRYPKYNLTKYYEPYEIELDDNGNEILPITSIVNNDIFPRYTCEYWTRKK